MIGIYAITNLVNGKFYIGSAISCKLRKRVHFSKLKGGYHDNDHLQKSYNKYGSSNFTFTILQELPPGTSDEDIEIIEANYIKYLRPHYNKTYYTGRRKRVRIKEKIIRIPKPMKDICNTPEFKLKMSIATSRHYASLSEEGKARKNKHKIGAIFSEATRKKLSDCKKGKPQSEETRKKKSETLKAYWANKKQLK